MLCFLFPDLTLDQASWGIVSLQSPLTLLREESPVANLEVSVDSMLVTPGSTPATGSTPNLVDQSVGNSILSVSASANL
ncbi:UNVERIFIED_CONTAM: hypothetical protein Sindi_0066400, partial [Sesamum indicum]